jgi:hypothetical protein
MNEHDDERSPAGETDDDQTEQGQSQGEAESARLTEDADGALRKDDAATRGR